jgi:phosphonoacetaldehyde dehydrogenase
MADIRRESMRIAGEHVASERVIEVLNPWNGATVGTVPRGTVADIRRAFAAERSLILSRAAERLAARREEISDLITAESGLCKKDTLYEVGRAGDVFTFAAHAALIDDSQTFSCDVSAQGRRRRIHTQREPLRAISAITPFNHPLNQVAHKVAPSIATNNKMVLKPSEKTPLTALLLADVLYDVGLPPAMLSVVTGDPPEIADELITNPDCELITFTGGVAVGKSIASKMGYRRAVLELGGNDPLIVMEDADLQEASSLAVSGAYKNSGQRCTAVKRILVQESVAARFVDLLVEKTRLVKHGDPMDHTTDMGTVIDEAVAIRFQSLVDDAVSRGARLLHGNERRGALYSPTVLDRVPPDCELVARETFGPVAPVIRFREIEEAIRIANSTPYGLSSAVCTNRLDWITRFVNGLEVGTVNVREVPGYRLENSPFGGIKDSGLGYKEGVLEAMKSFTNVKTYSLPWA